MMALTVRLHAAPMRRPGRRSAASISAPALPTASRVSSGFSIVGTIFTERRPKRFSNSSESLKSTGSGRLIVIWTMFSSLARLIILVTATRDVLRRSAISSWVCPST
jgi:hypothetical protein